MNIGVDATALYGRYGGVEYSIWNLLSALNVVDLENRYTIYIPLDGPPAARCEAFSTRFHWVRLPFRGEEKARRVIDRELMRCERFLTALCHCAQP